jgi:hypothetical protein
MGQSWSSLHGQLTAYALAAGTAGVSALALSVPAHAEIVYTSVHQSIGRNGMLLLDINHDGIIDFTLREAFVFSNIFGGGSTWNNKLYIIPAAGGGIAGGFYTLFGMVGELPGGAGIGPRRSFMTDRPMVRWDVGLGDGYCVGSWCYSTTGFLGLRFQINGQTHYGWARLTAVFNYRTHSMDSQLIDYAYETSADTRILAGKMRGESSRSPSDIDTSVQQPATLGLLALGSSSFAVWRD